MKLTLILIAIFAVTGCASTKFLYRKVDCQDAGAEYQTCEDGVKL